MSGGRDGPDRIATMPEPTVTCSMPRRTMAAVWAVRHTTTRVNAMVRAAAINAAGGRR